MQTVAVAIVSVFYASAHYNINFAMHRKAANYERKFTISTLGLLFEMELLDVCTRVFPFPISYYTIRNKQHENWN